MIDAADELTPPSFAAYLYTACWSAARPGELDALKWADIDFGAETIQIDRQWNAKLAKPTPPKHGSRRTIALTDGVRDRLLTLPRESEWVFTTTRGTHYTPSARCFRWNRVRCAVGLGKTSLYLATRHFFGWYALNVLTLPAARHCPQSRPHGRRTVGVRTLRPPRRGNLPRPHPGRVPRRRMRHAARHDAPSRQT